MTGEIVGNWRIGALVKMHNRERIFSCFCLACGAERHIRKCLVSTTACSKCKASKPPANSLAAMWAALQPDDLQFVVTHIAEMRKAMLSNGGIIKSEIERALVELISNPAKYRDEAPTASANEFYEQRHYGQYVASPNWL